MEIKNILITGYGGYVGSNLIKYLIKIKEKFCQDVVDINQQRYTNMCKYCRIYIQKS